MASTDQARLRGFVETVVTRAGYDLEDLTVVAAGRRRLLRVVIDRDAGVDLDDAATVSREISAELDELDAADPMGAAAYTLEVTSPGIGRPLTLPRHFRRARGRLLAITTHDGGSLLGRVRAADDEGVDLLVGKTGTDPLTLAYPAIAKARVEVEFSAPSASVLAALGDDTAQLFAQPELVFAQPELDLDEAEDAADDDPGDDPDDELDEEPDEEPDEDEAEDLTTP